MIMTRGRKADFSYSSLAYPNFSATDMDDIEELLYVYNAIMKLSPGLATALDACKHKPALVLELITKVCAYMRADTLLT